MTNKEIANEFNLLAQLMELQDENDYKIRSYANAYRILRNVDAPLQTMTLAELKSIKGVGDAIGGKIQELQKDGKMRILEEFKAMTPKGIVALLGIKGLGLKKIQTLWKELEIESPGELYYACNENRLVTLKGFGSKTQDNIKDQLEYYFQSLEKYRWASLEQDAEDILLDIEDEIGAENILPCGQFRRLLPVVDYLEYVIAEDQIAKLQATDLLVDWELTENKIWRARSKEDKVRVQFYPSPKGFMGLTQLQTTGNQSFVKDILENIDLKSLKGLTEMAIFEKLEVPYIVPEIRDHHKIYWKIKNKGLPALISNSDIKGILHVHTQYSDGANKLADMISYVQSNGYQYIGITDHSQSAFYANGLKEERLEEQWKEIDELNKNLSDFKIFKGIESDIKFDGSLDYEDEVLAKFDFIIASVHSILKMTEEKATQRIITAVQNPFTTILGHPTGRLLLSRAGYPLDHKAVIDACAKYRVAIEINANPHRLDLDYEWLPYALEQGVKIAINPDAHSLQGVHDIRFGVQVARKGLLDAENCINYWSAQDFSIWLKNKPR